MNVAPLLVVSRAAFEVIYVIGVYTKTSELFVSSSMQTEQFNETWSIVNFDWTSEMETGFLQVYNRPGQLFCRHFYFAVYIHKINSYLNTSI